MPTVRNKTFVYITGQMRSGTTLLSTLLDAQDDFHIAADQYRICGAMRVASGGIVDPRRILDDSLKRKFFACYLNATASGPHGPKRVRPWAEFLLENPDTMVKEGRPFKPHDIAKLPLFETIEQFYRYAILQTPKEQRFLGNKETRGEPLAPLLCQDDIKGVIILRDPRDSALSYLKKNETVGKFGGGDDLKSVIEMWRKGFHVWSAAKENANILCIRYEDLILKQDETFHAMSNFFGTIVAPKPVKMGNSSFGDVQTGEIRDTAVDRWKSAPDHPAVISVTEKLRGEMKKAGYERERANLGLSLPRLAGKVRRALKSMVYPKAG